jgi:enoyl-CoA hydratase/carnithine racemase
MNEQKESSYAKGNLSFKIIDNIAVLNLKNNIFELITDLSETAEFFNLIEQAKTKNEIHALLITNENGCLSGKVYSEFLNTVKKESSQNGFQLSSGVTRTRQIVNLNNFIRKAIEFDKLIFIGLQGEIATPFLGASLAADFRFASENTELALCHLKMGVHPAGALPYFLPKYVNYANVYNILFNGENISADEALNLGLVNTIFSSATFEQDCINRIREIVEGNEHVLKCTKRLLKFSTKDLEEYIDLEECNFISS